VHQRALARHHEEDGILQFPCHAAFHKVRRHQRLVEKAQDHKHHEHRFVETRQQMVRFQTRQPGPATMAGAKSTNEQQAHGHEQDGADADGKNG
jgi:hypothetical protein